jgi:hypothetical protein
MYTPRITPAKPPRHTSTITAPNSRRANPEVLVADEDLGSPSLVIRADGGRPAYGRASNPGRRRRRGTRCFSSAEHASLSCGSGYPVLRQHRPMPATAQQDGSEHLMRRLCTGQSQWRKVSPTVAG